MKIFIKNGDNTSVTIGLKEKQLERVVERVVLRVLQKALKDPDFGLELQPGFEKSLRKSITLKESGQLKDFSEILAKVK